MTIVPNARSRRVRAMVVVVCVLTVIASPTRAAVTERAPAEAPIQPGGAVCGIDDVASELADLQPCDVQGTLSFVFEDQQGALYIGTAAHVFPDGSTQAYVPSCGDCGGLERTPFGDVVFSSDSVDFAHPITDDPEPDLLDFALIKIRRPWYKHVDSRVRYWGGPVGVLRSPEAATTDSAVAYGNGKDPIPNTCLPTPPSPGPRGPGEVIAASRTTFSSTVCEVGGDSGMPYLHGPSGKALGVNGNCPCGGPGYYPTVEHVLERLAAAGLRVDIVTGAPAPPLEALISR